MRLLIFIAAAIALIVFVSSRSDGSDAFPAPSRAALAGLDLGDRVVKIARSQLGYRTDPTDTYCNKFSAYWGAGSGGCPGGELSEEWCADFAAWAWRKAGARFQYGYGPADINAGAVSFYLWSVANGTWHPASSGYRARPGDVAVYGISAGAASAAHVGIVVADHGSGGPQVINGDGDRTGFSVVEEESHEIRADAGHGGNDTLAGYVRP